MSIISETAARSICNRATRASSRSSVKQLGHPALDLCQEVALGLVGGGVDHAPVPCGHEPSRLLCAPVWPFSRAHCSVMDSASLVGGVDGQRSSFSMTSPVSALAGGVGGFSDGGRTPDG